jgi:hypothetical protein
MKVRINIKLLLFCKYKVLLKVRITKLQTSSLAKYTCNITSLQTQGTVTNYQLVLAAN